jgi:hypothetical protein
MGRTCRGLRAQEQPSRTSLWLATHDSGSQPTRRVQAQHSTPLQQSRVPDIHAGSDMLCRGDVVAVVFEVGNWHVLSVCAVEGN